MIKRKLATKIICIVLALLMIGGVALTLINLLPGVL